MVKNRGPLPALDDDVRVGVGAGVALGAMVGIGATVGLGSGGCVGRVVGIAVGAAVGDIKGNGVAHAVEIKTSIGTSSQRIIFLLAAHREYSAVIGHRTDNSCAYRITVCASWRSIVSGNIAGGDFGSYV